MKDARRKAGMTQAQLATKLNCTRDSLVNMETGRADITFASVILICQALGVNPETIVSRVINWTEKEKYS